MADKDGPSLELPSFLGGHKKKRTEPEPEPEPEAAESEPAPEMETAPETAPAPAVTHVDAPGQDAAPAPTKPPRRRQRPALPALSGGAAAIVTGLVVGLLLVGLTFLALQGCSAARGVSSCGGTGFGILLVILVALTWIGAIMLGAWNVEAPGSTSLLAMGLLVVVTLLFLADLLFQWWMVIAIPLIAVVSYSLSRGISESLAHEAT